MKVQEIKEQKPEVMRFEFTVADSHDYSVEQNGNDGVIISSSSNDTNIVGNVLRENGDDGIEVDSDNNKIHGTVAQSNGEDGIDLSQGSTGNRVSGNTATDNIQNDLSDDNPTCADNVWTGNQFGTASPATCIT